MRLPPLIRLIDDDPTVSASLSFVLEVAGLRVKAYPSAQAFLSLDDFTVPGCLLLDVRMPEMSGLELQNRMKHEGIALPIVFLSAHGNIEMAVAAVQNGAVDFLVKPPRPKKLVEALKKACSLDADRAAKSAELKALEADWQSLTHAEAETAHLIAKGLSSKEIAEIMHVTDDTVRNRRSSLYAKLDVRAPVEIADLLHRMITLQNELGTSSRGSASSELQS